ncbi:hypothetical protein DFH06DRAFT_1197842 [Mycena polygramma]|nr:hypothetical protein DFH06DRAFT_1197842 [Mycena polygramma]
MLRLFVLLLVSLGLFFGLFFGLNYPEIVRHGWPLTRCTILSSEIATRYCCETSCSTGSCKSAPSGSPQCASVISSIDTGYSPSSCAANSSTCPTQSGSVCDGGYYCCSTCCQTCQSCTTSCSGSPSVCTQSCTSYSCNCYCCSSSNDLYCTLSCPICYNVDVQLSYSSRDGQLHPNVSYTQDFKKDVNSADNFLNQHLANSTSFCYYNPKDENQVLFNVGFTKWKWAVTAIFGIFPLFIALALLAYFILVPVWNWFRDGYNESRYASKAKAWGRERLPMLSPWKKSSPADHEADDKDVPPPAYSTNELGSRSQSI